MKLFSFLIALAFSYSAHASYILGGGLITYDKGNHAAKPVVQAKYLTEIRPMLAIGGGVQWSETGESKNSLGIATTSTLSAIFIESRCLHGKLEVGPFVGLKLGMIFLNTDSKLNGVATSTNDATALGLGVVAGHTFPLVKDFSISPELSLMSVRTKDALTTASATVNAVLFW